MHQPLTVAEVLDFAEVQVGKPRILAGESELARPVRWAHVIAGDTALHLLDGGELLLTTGAGWPVDDANIARLAAGLAKSSPAAILIELGSFLPAVPAALVAVCEGHGIPLIELTSEVRFSHITQRVHQQILHEHTEALTARANVHQMLTELGLNRSPVEYVVERLADTLSAPVVLEDAAGHVVAWARAGSTLDSINILAPWAGRECVLPDGWERVPVEAQGRFWGTLTALPGPAHPAGRRTVLELGAFALAIGRLGDPSGEQWPRLGARRALSAMLEGRYSSNEDLATQLAAAGLPTQSRVLLAVAVRPFMPALTERAGRNSRLAALTQLGDDVPGILDIFAGALQRAVQGFGDVIIAHELGSTTGENGTLLALLSLENDTALQVVSGSREIGAAGAATSAAQSAAATVNSAVPRIAHRLAEELKVTWPASANPGVFAHFSIGEPVAAARLLVNTLEDLRNVGALAVKQRVGRVLVQQFEQHRLAGLVRSLSGLPEVQRFAHTMLQPIIDHDSVHRPGHPGDLLQVLRIYLEHPTNRSLASQQAQLSRSVFYQRIDLLSELLGMDLTDGNVIASLHVALLAYDARG